MKTPTSTLRRKFEAYQKSPHELLRHSLASLLIAKRLDPVFVSRQLGHSSPAITLEVYAHLFAQRDHVLVSEGHHHGPATLTSDGSDKRTKISEKSQAPRARRALIDGDFSRPTALVAEDLVKS